MTLIYLTRNMSGLNGKEAFKQITISDSIGLGVNRIPMQAFCLKHLCVLYNRYISYSIN